MRGFVSWLASWFGPPAPPPISFDRPLCFLHIPKTAGITVRQFLTLRFPPGQTYNVPYNPACASDLGILGQDVHEFHQRKPHLAYLSHVPYAWLRNFPQRPHLFLILRDPVDRVLSHYYFLRELVTQGSLPRPHPLVEKVATMEIGEFLRQEFDRSRAFFGELQTRWLTTGPCWELPDYEPGCTPALGRADLRRAKRHLRECVVVGLAHRLLESLQLLCDVFGWPAPDEVGRENRTGARPSVADLDVNTLRLLNQITAFDRQLFAEGARLFERQWARRGRRRARRLDAPASFSCHFDQGIPGHGWYAPEPVKERWYSWTGRSAWLEFPLRPSPRVEVTIEAHHAVDPDLYPQLRILINGHRVESTITAAPEPGCPVRYRAVIDAAGFVAPPAMNRITLELPRTVRPSEAMPGHPDERPLGIAISRVEVRAACAADHDVQGPAPGVVALPARASGQPLRRAA